MKREREKVERLQQELESRRIALNTNDRDITLMTQIEKDAAQQERDLKLRHLESKYSSEIAVSDSQVAEIHEKLRERHQAQRDILRQRQEAAVSDQQKQFNQVFIETTNGNNSI